MIGGRCGLVISQVARCAIRTEADKAAHGGVLVAGVAFDCRMRPHEREPVLVILHALHRDTPPAYGVTLLAVVSELLEVNVGVAVGALFPDISKNQLGVTLLTIHADMIAAQRKSGFLVIESGGRPDRSPTGSGVTVLAGHAESSVGTKGSALLFLVARGVPDTQSQHRKTNQPREAHPFVQSRTSHTNYLLFQDHDRRSIAVQ